MATRKTARPTSKQLIASLDAYLCDKEVYKGKKNPKKPQVSRGNIREIRALICKQMANSSTLVAAMIMAGTKMK